MTLCPNNTVALLLTTRTKRPNLCPISATFQHSTDFGHLHFLFITFLVNVQVNLTLRCMVLVFHRKNVILKVEPWMEIVHPDLVSAVLLRNFV
jgi:hypothetical protein